MPDDEPIARIGNVELRSKRRPDPFPEQRKALSEFGTTLRNSGPGRLLYFCLDWLAALLRRKT